jgi:hypothetical protein
VPWSAEECLDEPGWRWRSAQAEQVVFFRGRSGCEPVAHLREIGNPDHRLRAEHDQQTLLIHLSNEDGHGWTVFAVDRRSRELAVARTGCLVCRDARPQANRPPVRTSSTATRGCPAYRVHVSAVGSRVRRTSYEHSTRAQRLFPSPTVATQPSSHPLNGLQACRSGKLAAERAARPAWRGLDRRTSVGPGSGG